MFLAGKRKFKSGHSNLYKKMHPKLFSTYFMPLQVSFCLDELDYPNGKYWGNSSLMSWSKVKLICKENAVFLCFLQVFVDFPFTLIWLPLVTDQYCNSPKREWYSKKGVSIHSQKNTLRERKLFWLTTLAKWKCFFFCIFKTRHIFWWTNGLKVPTTIIMFSRSGTVWQF